VHARPEPECDRLFCEREGARDQRLRCDDGRDGCDGDGGIERPPRRECVEWIIEQLWLREDARRFADVTDDERGKDEPIPGEHDRSPTEVRHIGVERFDARNCEDDAAEHEEATGAMRGHKRDRMNRIECRKNRRVGEDTEETGDGDREKPCDHRGAEEAPDAARPARLHGKESHEDGDRDRDEIRMHDGARDVEPFDCGDDADGGRDRAIAQEHRRADHDDRRDETEGDGRAVLLRRHRAREQGENAAFTVVIDLHDERDVFETHDDNERPYQERCNAEDVAHTRRIGAADGKARFERVEWARADIAKHDAERRNGEGVERLFSGDRDGTLLKRCGFARASRDVRTPTAPCISSPIATKLSRDFELLHANDCANAYVAEARSADGYDLPYSLRTSFGLVER